MAGICLSRHATLSPYFRFSLSPDFRFSPLSSASSGFRSPSSINFPRIIHCRRMRVHSVENGGVLKNPIVENEGVLSIVENEGVPKNPIEDDGNSAIEDDGNSAIAIEDEDDGNSAIEDDGNSAIEDDGNSAIEDKDKICDEIENKICGDLCVKEDYWLDLELKEKEDDLKEKKEEEQNEEKKEEEQNEEDAKKIWRAISNGIWKIAKICFQLWNKCCRICQSIHNRIWIWKMKQQALETMMVHERERAELEMSKILKTTQRHLAERRRLARMIEMSNTQAMKEARKAQKKSWEYKQKFLAYLIATFTMVSTFLKLIKSFISVYEDVVKQEQLLQLLVGQSSSFVIWFLAMWEKSPLFKWMWVLSCLSFFIWFLVNWILVNWKN